MQRLAVRIARWLKGKVPPDEEIEIVTVVPTNTKGQVLLVRRTKDDDSRPGEWECPGGHRDPGESLLETAKRELSEEIGVDILLQPGREYFTLREGGFGVMLKGLVLDEKIDLEPEEHDRYVWVNPRDIHKFHPVPPDFHEEVTALLRKSQHLRQRVVSR